MFFIIVEWCIIGSSEDDQYIGPFDTEKDAQEWGNQIIGSPDGTPWGVCSMHSPTSCVKQFKDESNV